MTNLTHSYVFTSNYCLGNGMDNICLPAYLFSSTLHYNFNAIEMLQFAKDFLFKIYIWFSNIGIFVVCSSVVMEVEVYHFFFWMKASSSHCITKYYFRQSKELHLSLNCFWVDLWLVFVTLDVILWHDRTAAGPRTVFVVYLCLTRTKNRCLAVLLTILFIYLFSIFLH